MNATEYLVGIDMGDEAITYRPALEGDKSIFGVHLVSRIRHADLSAGRRPPDNLG
jgi:hypothetical protein